MIEKLQKHYGNLFEPELLAEINHSGTYKELPEGFTLMDIGQYVKGMPLLLSGAVKVLREDKDGDELLLYFLEKGDTCAMTLSCCMGQTKSKIKAIAETDTTFIMVPVQKMEEWTSKYKTWREFVFESYHKRLMEVLETIDSIAFYNMDERLLKYLREKVKVTKSNVIHNTHQEIAYELHTSRVVVSRLLKNLEKLGVVELRRNSINVISE